MPPISLTGVAESGDDFTKFSTIYQWFQTLIHPLIQQRPLTQ
ncbi:NADH:flavin oxidoreductases, Old Yellow Enzyme family [Richelia intracellularis]|nr:NADH:flavin oxidoreductases, Old Yellow Enzyme family [Richelia intracellularis]